jgi:hypothetical protein
MNISRVGIDLAKNVFQLHGVDRHGKTVLKRCLSREKWLRKPLRASYGILTGIPTLQIFTTKETEPTSHLFNWIISG